MKTSLIIADQLFAKAKKEAVKQNKNISEVIGYWAMLGYQLMLKQKKERPSFKPVNLEGSARVNINRREDWMDDLER